MNTHKNVKYFLSTVLVFISVVGVHAQVLLQVNLNKKAFDKGDTLVSDCKFFYNDVAYAASTLHVWIENKAGTKTWKYRYPLMNGKCLFNLIISDSLQQGGYAVNYLVQPQFFKVKGTVRNYDKRMNGISMLLASKESGSHATVLTPDSNGVFETGRILFTDTAQLTFTPNNKKGGQLWVNIETPLDSGFQPIAMHTELVTIGQREPGTVEDYQFNEHHFKSKAISLTEIVVTADVKAKKLKEFQKQNVSTRFKGLSQDINGLYNEEMIRSQDIFIYLQRQVTGLEILPRGTGYIILNRGAYVDIFLDEVQVTSFELAFLHPGDVALIKIFDASTAAGPTMRYGGTLAIYTKKGEDLKEALQKRSVYYVSGYSHQVSNWK